MAGGLGKRMLSDTPKVLHLINGEPMLVKIIKQALQLNPTKILIVVGKYKSIIQNCLLKFIDNAINQIEFIYQSESLGTGHAIMCCIDYLLFCVYNANNANNANNTINANTVLVLSGDTPLISSETMQNMIDYNNQKSYNNTIMTTILENPHGNGRIIRNINDNTFIKIIEEKDCNSYEKDVKEVNCGIYVFNIKTLCENITKIDRNNAQNEYYLTDIFKHITHNLGIYELKREKQYELINVNTPEQLTYASTFI